MLGELIIKSIFDGLYKGNSIFEDDNRNRRIMMQKNNSIIINV